MYRIIVLLFLPLVALGCESQGSRTGLANPASVNCEEKGGKVMIETAGDGGQYGICTFEDNRQCEEWALMRGECPDGGIKVTGYVTPAARYCALRGGAYKVAQEATSGVPEKGVCKLPDGTRCSADAFYNGTCPTN